MRFRELVNKVPNARHVWFAWNLADTNNYLPWLFGKDIPGRSAVEMFEDSTMYSEWFALNLKSVKSVK